MKKNKKILIVVVIIIAIIAYRAYKKRQAVQAVGGGESETKTTTALGNAISLLTGNKSGTSSVGADPIIMTVGDNSSAAISFDAKGIANKLIKDIDGVSLVVTRDTATYKIAANTTDSNLISINNWYWTLYGKSRNETLREALKKEKFAAFGDTLTYANKIGYRLKNLNKR